MSDNWIKTSNDSECSGKPIRYLLSTPKSTHFFVIQIFLRRLFLDFLLLVLLFGHSWLGRFGSHSNGRQRGQQSIKNPARGGVALLSEGSGEGKPVALLPSSDASSGVALLF